MFVFPKSVHRLDSNTQLKKNMLILSSKNKNKNHILQIVLVTSEHTHTKLH